MRREQPKGGPCQFVVEEPGGGVCGDGRERALGAIGPRSGRGWKNTSVLEKHVFEGACPIWGRYPG